MARIPTSASISGPGSLRSGRPIARQNTTAEGEGLANFGRGLSNAGSSIVQVAREQQQKQNTIDVARAELAKTEGLLGVTNSFDRDTEFATYGERAETRAQEAVNQAAQLIRDPEMRERWKLTALGDAVRTTDTIRDRGIELQTQQERVTFEETLEANRRLYVDPDLPESIRQKAREDIEASIAVAEQNGLVSPDGAQAWRETFIENADYQRALLEVQRDPDVLYGAGDSSEAAAGEVAGVVSAGAGYTIVQLPDGTTERREGTRAWRNNNPGNIEYGPFARSMGAVGSDGRFAVFPTYEAGREAKRALLFESSSYRNLSISGAISRYAPSFENDTNGYISQVASAVGVDPGTPVSALSKEQQEAMLDAMERVEGFRPGKSSTGGRVASTAAPQWYQRLSPEQRLAVDNEAQQVRNQKSAETRARIEMAAADAPAAIQNTGRYDGYSPTSSDFLAAYGPVEAPQRYAQYQQSVEVSQQAFSMRNLSVADINAMVDAAKPTATGQGAAMEQQRYETLAKAAEQTITARTEDPASYTLQNFPRVAAAWEQAATDPSQVRNAMTMTWAAQNQLGLPVAQRQLLPNAVAEQAIQTFQNVEVPERDRIDSVAGLIFSSPDVGQQRAVFNQLVEAGLPEISEGAMDALARGDQGAARRLFLAAMVDPSELPGSLPNGVTPSRISEEIQSQLMDVGQIGDVYYGLSDGSAENFARASRDQQLIQNAVRLRLRDGENLRDAVANVAKDLYGDVRVVNGNWDVNARLLLPSDADAGQVLDGLKATLPQVRETLNESLVPEGEAPVGEAAAVIDAATENYINNVLAEGYFRNAEGGYVFIDPFIGAAVSDANGKPIIFTETAVSEAAAQPRNTEEWRERANAMLESNEINEEQHRAILQEIAVEEQRAMGLVE